MCKSNYNANKLVAKDMAVLTAAVGETETEVTIDSRYEKVVGISIGESYSRAVMGQVNLSLRVDSEDRIINVPLTQFFPDGERQMWPIEYLANVKVIAKLTIRNNTLNAATPIPLIFHCAQKTTC